MLIALDYDNTYNADKPFFQDFMHLARKYGHKVVICTMRSKELDWHEDFDYINHHHEVDTVFCDGNPKRKFMEGLGYEVDWWFDDFPEGVHLGSQHTSSELAQWRVEQKE